MYLRKKKMEMEMEIEMLEIAEKWQALVYITTVLIIGITFITIIMANRGKDG